MDRYIVTEPVTLHAGVVSLKPEQVEHRERNLKKLTLRPNCYEIIRPVQFKRGEEIGYEGDMPRSMADNLTEKAKFEAEAKKHAEADAKARKKAEEEAAKQREKEEAEAKKAAEKAAKIRAQIEADARKQWDANAALRTEHADNFDAFLAALLEQLG